jgi:hypothetical protein
MCSLIYIGIISRNWKMSDNQVPPPRPFVEMVLVDESLDANSTPSSANARTITPSNPWTLSATAHAAQLAKNAQGVKPPAAASQPLKQKRKNFSYAWDYFKKSTDEKSATCLSDGCRWNTTCEDGSTSNMRKHLRNEHKVLVC